MMIQAEIVCMTEDISKGCLNQILQEVGKLSEKVEVYSFLRFSPFS